MFLFLLCHTELWIGIWSWNYLKQPRLFIIPNEIGSLGIMQAQILSTVEPKNQKQPVLKNNYFLLFQIQLEDNYGKIWVTRKKMKQNTFYSISVSIFFYKNLKRKTSSNIKEFGVFLLKLTKTYLMSESTINWLQCIVQCMKL